MAVLVGAFDYCRTCSLYLPSVECACRERHCERHIGKHFESHKMNARLWKEAYGSY